MERLNLDNGADLSRRAGYQRRLTTSTPTPLLALTPQRQNLSGGVGPPALLLQSSAGQGRPSWASHGSSTFSNGCIQPSQISTSAAKVRKYDTWQRVQPHPVGGWVLDQPMDWNHTTTLMLRHLPRSYQEADLIGELLMHVDKESFNFVYVPWGSRCESNMGYAFVNFLESRLAQRVYQRLHGGQWRLYDSWKKIEIQPAHLQGFVANLAHYYGSAAVEEGSSHRPIVLHQGQQIHFLTAVRIFCPQDVVAQHMQTESMKQNNAGSSNSTDEHLRDSSRSAHDHSDCTDSYSDREVAVTELELRLLDQLLRLRRALNPYNELQNIRGSCPRTCDIPFPSFIKRDTRSLQTKSST